MIFPIANLVWLTSLFFTCLSWAQAPWPNPEVPLVESGPFEPWGRLKVTLDHNFALSRTWQRPPTPLPPPAEGEGPTVPETRDDRYNIVYSSHLTFSTPVAQLFNDGQLWEMAYEAYQEMMDSAVQYHINVKKLRPGAMSVMAWGNQIILASSQKGESFTYDSAIETPVLQDLRLCQASSALNGEHRTRGSCGEEMAAHLYYILNPNGPKISELKPQAVIGTWVWSASSKLPYHQPWKTLPCGNSQNWGCNYFTGSGNGGQNFRVLENSVISRPYTLPNDVVIDQIQLCGGIRTYV
ncbi:hypothetical protein QBC38DRAFT_526015 [Podospora fimiseda]|uniref:Uncharacterized protein n=1 Tax=Podospora fimiseda TaxID=252190 RepID=A0AAN6YLI7_9PEZI|nr:hypothetical protein QBC38DRAFT_526015 [Podospora fimiseda]